MAVSTKTIKRRIKSISNTKKITKAMEMISAVKMRRAVANVLATRNYANLAWEMLKEIGQKTNVNLHPLLKRREVKRVGVILITSNRGLAGGFSSRLLQTAHNYLSTVKAKVDLEADVILTGRRGKKIFHKFGHTVVAEFDKIDLTTRIEEVLPMAQIAVRDYISGKYDKIVIAYTDFISAIKQEPTIKEILPFREENGQMEKPIDSYEETGESTEEFLASESNKELEEQSKVIEAAKKSKEAIEKAYKKLYSKKSEEENWGFKFEPGPEEVLNQLLPRLVEMQIYQAVLESDASEHSARMMAMRSASDAAGDMIKELNYSFNKARQAAITQEIAEIVGGAAALG